MPTESEGGTTQHVVITGHPPDTGEPKWKRALKAARNWVRSLFGGGASAEPAVAAPATVPAKPPPHVDRPGDPPDTGEPKLIGPRLGTDPDEHAPKPPATAAHVLSPQLNPSHPLPPLGTVPTGPQAHVVAPGDPPPTDEPKDAPPVPGPRKPG